MRKKLKKIPFFRSFFSNFFWSPISRIVPKNVEGDLKKTYLTSISSASRSSVTFSVSSSQLIKLIKSVTSLVLKKSLYYSLRFSTKKRRLKKAVFESQGYPLGYLLKLYYLTSRERPKSAPYLRLKNSKKTSKCQVLSSTVPKKISKNVLNFLKFLVSRIVPKNVKGALWLFFNIHSFAK